MTVEEAVEVILTQPKYETCKRCTGYSFLILNSRLTTCPDCAGQGRRYTPLALEAFVRLAIEPSPILRDRDDLIRHVTQVVEMVYGPKKGAELRREEDGD